MELWICGQLIGEWKASASVWEFQGAFSNKELAVAACRDERYFIFSYVLDAECPHESVLATDTYYPKANGGINHD
jgi:hypothetical protein